MYRCVLVVRSKQSPSQRHTGSGRCDCFDTQTQVLMMCFMSAALLPVVWIDIISTEGIYSESTVYVIGNISTMFVILAGGQTIYVFVKVHSRFHPPSKRVASLIGVMALAFAVLEVVGTFIPQPVSTYVTSSAAFLFLALLFVVATVYAVAVVRPPTDAAVARAQSHEERESRQRLLTVIRGLQVTAAVATCCAVAGIFAQSIWTDSLQTFIVLVSLSLLLLLMGRVKKIAPAPAMPTPVQVSSCCVALYSYILFLQMPKSPLAKVLLVGNFHSPRP
jgi:hypothetical protein